MPALETIERFKSQVFSLADEPAHRLKSGLSATLDIAPPEPEIDEDLAGLLGEDQQPLDLESLAGALEEESPPEAAEQQGMDDGDLPFDLFEPLGEENTDFPLPVDNESEPLADTGDLEDFSDSSALLEGFSEELVGDDSPAEVLAGEYSPPMDFGSDSLERNVFSGDSLTESINFDDIDTSGSDFGFDEDFSGTSDELIGLGGLSGATEEEIASFDENSEADEFALGDFSSQFGLTADETETSEEVLNPAARVEQEIAETQRGLTLTDEEFLILQKTLAALPLNLKLAVEELIGEKDVAFDDLGRLVRLLVTSASAKNIAALAGKLLGKTIKIPAGYTKGTGQALEQHKGSLGYLTKTHMWPILRRFVLAAALTALGLQLGYNYIYTPWKANSLYDQGLALIQSGDSEKGDELFSDAWRRWSSEERVFQFAEAHASQGEYERAQKKFRDFLKERPMVRDPATGVDVTRFENEHKAGLLAYHFLVRDYGYDGLNKTSHLSQALGLLDPLFRVNYKDKDALLAKGDLYALWSQVSPEPEPDPGKNKPSDEKYRNLALGVYGEYSLYHGEDSEVLYRRLKLFRLSGNEKMVMIYRNAVMANKKLVLPPAEVADLAGWLIDRETQRRTADATPKLEMKSLEQELTPSLGPGLDTPKNPGYLIGVKELLFKAQEAEPTLPQIHYQLARYFRLQENTVDEEKALGAADNFLHRADVLQTRTSSGRRMQVDTANRIGEVFLRKGQIQQAGQYFETARNLFEDALASRLLEPHRDFGKIYSNLGDIYYENTPGQWPQALELYKAAEKGLYSTPEQNYRMGVIEYGLGQYSLAIDRFSQVEMTPGFQASRNTLFALANSLYRSGNYFGAMGYYRVLLDSMKNVDAVRKVSTVMDESRRDADKDQVNRTSIAEVIQDLEPNDRTWLKILVTLWNNLGVADLRSRGAMRQDSLAFETAAGYISRAEILSNAMGRDSESMIKGDETQVQINLRNLMSPGGSQDPVQTQDLDIYSDLPRSVSQPW